MSGIKRWDWVNKMVRGDDHGRFVKYADHAAEIARLRAEADALRVDAERWRYVRQQSGVTVSVEESDDDGDKQFVSGHSPQELDEAIDAAMGADA